MLRTTLVFIALLASVAQAGVPFPEPGDPTHKLVLRGKPWLGERRASPMSFSPDGRRFAAADEKEIVIWDTEKAKEIVRLQAVTEIKHVNDLVTALAFSADGTLLASGNYGGVIKVWDAATGKERLSIRGRWDRPPPIITVAFDVDNKSLVSICGPDLWATPTYEINVWDPSTGREIRAIRNGRGASFGFGGLSLSPNGQLAAAAQSWQGKFTIWDLTTGREKYTLDERISNGVFSQDSKSFAGFVSGEGILVWDVATGRAMHSLKLPSNDDFAGGFVFSPDGKRLSAIVTGNREFDPTKAARETSALYVWEIASGKEILRKDIQGRVGASVFSADGNHHALNAGDGYIRIWNKAKAKQ